MSQQLPITDPAELSKITKLVHDMWFSADGIVYDPTRKDLLIPFVERRNVAKELAHKSVSPAEIFPQSLIIHNVLEYDIEDTEQVGEYDLNELLYNAESHRIQITTGVPIKIEAKVNTFHITLVLSE